MKVDLEGAGFEELGLDSAEPEGYSLGGSERTRW